MADDEEMLVTMLPVLSPTGDLIINENQEVLLHDGEDTYCFVGMQFLPQDVINEHATQLSLMNKASQASVLSVDPPTQPHVFDPECSTMPTTSHASSVLPIDPWTPLTESGLCDGMSAASTSHADMTTDPQSPETQLTESGEQRAAWSRSQILALIYSYKQHRALFQSGTMKHVEVWRKIAQCLKPHSHIQCKAKFKALKALYMKKKDNMRSTSSGAAAIQFQYFEEFDEIFRQEPNVVPVAIASSSQHHNDCRSTASSTGASAVATTEAGSSADIASAISAEEPASAGALSTAPAAAPEGELTSPIRRRRTRFEIQMDRFIQSMNERETRREERFSRLLQMQMDCTNRICEVYQKFLDKM